MSRQSAKGIAQPQRHSQSLIDRFTAAGTWGCETINDRFRSNVASFGTRLAVADAPNRETFADGPPRRLTYADLDAEVANAAALMRELGVGEGDVVVYQMPNVVEAVVLLLASARVGAVISPLLVQFEENEVAQTVARLRPKLFFAGRFKKRDLAAAAEPICVPIGCRVVRIDDGIPRASTADDSPATAGDANALFSICWTSGTEGEPKGVMRTHNNWFATGRSMYCSAGLRGGEVILTIRPLVNMAAIGGSFMSWLLCAGTLILHHPLDMDIVLQQIRDEGVEMTFMPPAFFVSLLKDDDLRARADLSSVRVMGTGSAPIPAWALEAVEREFGIEIVNFFGSNEGSNLMSSIREVPEPELRATLFPRLGRSDIDWPSHPPARECETMLVDPESGEEITTPGRAGELRIFGPSIFVGYFDAPELTAKSFDEHGRYRTGDLFEIAGDGELSRFYRFVGRNKDIIIRGGIKIAPAELDGLIAGFERVREAAFFGYPDERLGEKVGVAVVARDGGPVRLDDVIDFMKAKKVAVFKLPQRILVLDELPRNALLKVRRDELRRVAEQTDGE